MAEKIPVPGNGRSDLNTIFDSNPVFNAIRERRSIRRFDTRDVRPDIIDKLVEAAAWAPSANNEQPWKFVIVRKRSVKDKMTDAVMNELGDYYREHDIPLERMRKFWSSVFSAPVMVFAFCDHSGTEFEKQWEAIQRLWSMQGVSLACQNLLLAAHALGLGSVWLGLTLAIEDEIKEMLDVPDGMCLVTAVALGYPDQERQPPTRRPVSQVVFSEKWGGAYSDG